MRALGIAFLVAGCAARPCERPDAERGYRPVPERALEMVVVVDGSAAFATERESLEEVWRTALWWARYERDDGEAAYLNERVRVRFVAAGPGCTPPSCNGSSAAEWIRYSPARDDDAFEAQALCLWRAVSECAENRPLEALLEALESEPIEPRAALRTVIVTPRDDASAIDPSAAARELIALAEPAQLHIASLAAGPPAEPPFCGRLGLDSHAVPRLVAFVEALLGNTPRVEAYPLCGEGTEMRSLGGDGATLDYRYRRSLALVPDERGVVACELEEALPVDGPVAHCGDIDHLGRTLLRVDPDGREVCTIEQRPARDGPGWYHEPDLSELRFVSGSQPMPNASLTLRCRSAARACTTDEDCVPSLADPRHPPFVRCDPEHGVCVFACDDECDWPSDTCERVDPDLRGWCAPAPVCE